MINNASNTAEPFLSVVMPAFNEAATLREIVDRVLKVPVPLELVLVDDGSTDGTADIARELAEKHPEIRLDISEANLGKTASLKRGIAMTRGEVVIIQDADLEYDPDEIKDVIYPIVGGHADVVYGSRFMIRRAARVLYFDHYLANKALTFISNLLTNLNMTDVETCYKAFRGEIIRQMVITSSGFGFEIEVTAKVAKLRCVVYEVPISYYGRTFAEGKKIGYKDGIAALWYIIHFNIFRTLGSSYRELPDLRKVGVKRAAAALSTPSLGD